MHAAVRLFTARLAPKPKTSLSPVMTIQRPEHFLYQDKNHWLVAWHGEPLFRPEEHGFRPAVGRDTSCGRGYVCTYGLEGEQLVLDGLDIVHVLAAGESAAPPLNDRKPVRRKPVGREMLELTYQGLALAVPFSGGLLIGGDHVRVRHFSLGFDRVWGSKRVVELLFAGGRLTSSRDHSSEVNEYRDRFNERADAARLHAQEEVRAWLRERFSAYY